MPGKHPPQLTPELEDELRHRLEQQLDERDDVADKRRRVSKKLGGYLRVLDETIALTRRQLKGVDLEQLEIPGTERPAPALDPLVADILRLAGGIVLKPGTPPAAAGAEPEPLEWRTREPGLDVAGVYSPPAGEYQLRATATGGVTAAWCPDGGRSKLLAVDKGLDDAKDACRAHNIERAADEMLRSSGSGDLTRADTKGDAVARKPKRGGR